MLLPKLIRTDVAKRKPHNETLSLFYRFPAIPLWRNTQITYVNVGSVVDREGDVSRYFLDGLVWDEIKTMGGTRGKKENMGLQYYFKSYVGRQGSIPQPPRIKYNGVPWTPLCINRLPSARGRVQWFFFRSRRVTTLVKIYISTLSVTTVCRLW